MSAISDDQIGEYREAFTLFDRKGDNKIDYDQIGDVLRSLGLNPTAGEVKKIEKDVGKKRVSFEEFLPIYHSAYQKKANPSLEEFIEGFRVFDRDGTGTVQAAELRNLLTTLGEKLSDEDVNVLFATVDDNSGYINYEDFVKVIISA
ncbi:myosin-2 essential light chain-like [Actinia tenebrosa]|uniref:Myosin-2 essential light chain-like n=1 Tax=Actinia tenebrosa TaxID=6105 RepID=A0A6P8I212_ACTTE|nr:myosin-2 essential light chain-like [Actinia tenebrosa]